MTDRLSRFLAAMLPRLLLALAMASGLLVQSATAATPPAASAHGHGAAMLTRPLIEGAMLPRTIMAHAAHAGSPPRLHSSRLTTRPARSVPSAGRLVPAASSGVDTREPALGAATSPTTSTASLTLSVPIAAYGQTLKVTGAGFGASERVALSWDSVIARASSIVTASASGSFSTSLRVPLLVAGLHTLYAKGQSSGRVASAPFTMGGSVYLSKASSPPGGQVVMVGVGFGISETVTAYWASRYGLLLGRTTTYGDGIFVRANAITFTVPLSPTGRYALVVVGQHSGNTVIVPFAVTTPLTPTATPTPTALSTNTPTALSTNTPTITPTSTLPPPTDTPTNTPTTTPTNTATNTPTDTPTNTATATDTPTTLPTDTPTNTPIPTDTPTNTATDTPTNTATDTPTNTATPTPTRIVYTPSITLSPSSGSPGTTVGVSGVGFQPNEAVNLYFCGTYIGGGYADGAGYLGASFIVPNGYSNYTVCTVLAVGASSGASATTAFEVYYAPSLRLNPTSEPPGYDVGVSGTGFEAGEVVDLYFNGIYVWSLNVDSTGSVNAAFAVPYLCYCAGNVPVQLIGKTSGASAQVTFYYYTNTLNLTVSPTSGGAGTSVTGYGGGYEPLETVNVYFNGILVWAGLADLLGNVNSIAFNVPNICDFCSGTVPIQAIGQTSGLVGPAANFYYSYGCCRPGRHTPAAQVPAATPYRSLSAIRVTLLGPLALLRRISGAPPSTKEGKHV